MSGASHHKKSLLQRIWSWVDPNERYLRGLEPQVARINQLEAEFEKLSQQDLCDRLRKIRGRVEAARQAALDAQAELPPAVDSDAVRKRRKEVVDAEKAVLDAHLCEVFAAVREAAKRTLSMRHFDVQLLGGIVLHEGRIAEMKTGEGKTLTATAPLVLNALTGRGVHLITVNDYLARRDAEWMGKIYRYLGLTVGVIQHDLDRAERQYAYGCDITYITNHEIGFDYLRDHSSTSRPEHLVIRELHFAIIDEVDSILIDEAMVPLIISASRGKPVEKYRKVQEVVQRLILGTYDEETKESTGDLYIDEKAKNATLTEDGQRKVEIALGIENLNDSAHIEDMHLVSASLKANFCYKRDVDYIVGPGDYGPNSVIIVDSFTGRPQPGRRWSDGLHQAIEAKERVPIQDEQQTIATVTYQNFFLMYNRLAGMTGTAKTEEPEFVGIYDMPVVVVPTNKPMRRTEHQDVVYKTEEWKFRGICCEIAQYFCRRQPVLVGTRSVQTSERVSARLAAEPMRLTFQLLLLQWHLMENEKRIDKALLRELREQSTVPLERLKARDVAGFLQRLGLDPTVDSDANVAQLLQIMDVEDETALRDVLAHGVPHEVLNARHHEREAQIVAQAGRLGAVTIATNMAGRGTDIVLGGNPEPDVEALLERRGIDPKSLAATLFMNQALKGDPLDAGRRAEDEGGLPKAVLDEIAAIRAAWSSEQRDVVSTGGLHILGTERHESRRIDNQLRGRSGRQGDPGSSRFYVSLQDELMRLFGPERWGLLMNQWPEEQPVEAKLITRAMSNAQRKVEGRNFDIRKSTLRYDDVMNVQRQHIYAERRRVLEGVDLRVTVSAMMGAMADEALGQYAPADTEPNEWDLRGLWQELNQRFPLKDQLAFEDLQGLGHEALGERLRAAADRAYDDKENDFIRAVVEFELQASIHATLQEAADRNTVCGVLNALWPLSEHLPARLAGVSDSRLPEVLFQTARDAVESGPRRFVLTVMGDRLQQAAGEAAEDLAAGHEPAVVAAELNRYWNLRVDAQTLAELRDDQAQERLETMVLTALEEGGWTFARETLKRQMAATIDDALPAACNLDRLIAAIDSRWALGERLQARQFESLNYAVVEERLHRLVDQAVGERGAAFLAESAGHRLRWLAAEAAAGADPGELARRLRELLPASVSFDAGAVDYDAEALIATFGEHAQTGLVLRAVEEVAAQDVVAAHRQLSAALAGAEANDEDEELAFGDLNRLVERLKEQWAFGDDLDASELERLEASQVRGEMASTARSEVRSRGQAFVTATSRLRLRALIGTAVAEHYSLAGVCARLNQQLEVPGVFVPESYPEFGSNSDLVALLTQTAEDTLAEEEEKLAQFRRIVGGVVTDGLSLKRLCERLNAELNLSPALRADDLAKVDAEQLVEVLISDLAEVEPQFEQRFVLEAVLQHAHLTVDEAFERHYNVRQVSAEVSAAWPIRPDAVRASKLKGWPYNELARRLKEVLEEASRWEEWRYHRRLVLRLMAEVLDEQTELYCPAGAPRNRWDLAGLAAALEERWPLHQPIDPAGLPDVSPAALYDELLAVARRAYGEEERAFIRRTARHRYGQQIEQVRATHYSLPQAAYRVNEQWLLGNAIQPLQLAGVRAAMDQPARLEAAVRDLAQPVLEAAGAAFLHDAVNLRLVDSVQDKLAERYNVDHLLEALAGHWPLPEGEVTADELRALPQRDMVDRLRALLRTAGGALQRRLAYHHVRAAAAELELDEFCPGGAPETWQLAALADRLAARLPVQRAVEPAAFVAGVLRRATAGLTTAAAKSTQVGDQATLARAIESRVAAFLDDLLRVERGPQALLERSEAAWPVRGRLEVERLRPLKGAELRQHLRDALQGAFAADPAGFVAQASARWAQVTVAEALDRYWPAQATPGPWVLAQVVQELNRRWGQADLLHPTSYKGLERDELGEALRQAAHNLPAEVVQSLYVAEMVAEHLTARVSDLAARCGGAVDRPWDLAQLTSGLAEVWPAGSAAPTVEGLRALLTHDVVRAELRSLADAVEPRITAEYGTEAVQQWLERRLSEALDRTCSLERMAGDLSGMWPVGEIDAARLAALTYEQVAEAVSHALLEAAWTGGASFVRQAARNVAGDGVDGDDEALVQAFHDENVRRRLAHAVDEAQREHCNPEIASDRWDVPSFVAALERDWPIGGQLDAARLVTLGAGDLRAQAVSVLHAAFAADGPAFLRATCAQQLRNSVVTAIEEHATADRLVRALHEAWPREAEFDADTLSEQAREGLSEVIGQRLLRAGLADAAADTRAIAALVERHRGADLDAIATAMQQQWPAVGLLSGAELDEDLVGWLLQVRLDEDFQVDPRAFVKAVELEDVPRQWERRLMLEAIDTNWCDHLEAMDYLKEGINLRGYAQTDPFLAYRKEGRTMFENMLGRVREMVLSGLFETTEHELVEMHSHGHLGYRMAIQFRNIQELASKAEELTASHSGPAPAPAASGGGSGRRAAGAGAPAGQPQTNAPVTVDKVGRNDPCPCGSGRKYKHCCGRK